MKQFERIKYPDGQISAKFVPPLQGEDAFLIKERINSYEDLFYIRAIADALPTESNRFALFIPCMFGQRSDRRFAKFQSFDLKLITDVINECNFGKVQIFDPHSDVTLALINNSEKVSSFEYVKKAVLSIRGKMLKEGLSPSLDDILLVSPDAGAYKKVFEYGEKLNLPVMGAMKHRDKDGKIDLMFTHDVEGKDCLIVDDLCDGGYTFELLGKALKDHKARKVYLYVSHGIFSKGFKKLAEVIDHIYCTNSVKDTGPDEIVVRDPKSTIANLERIPSDFLTQYNVI